VCFLSLWIIQRWNRLKTEQFGFTSTYQDKAPKLLIYQLSQHYRCHLLRLSVALRCSRHCSISRADGVKQAVHLSYLMDRLLPDSQDGFAVFQTDHRLILRLLVVCYYSFPGQLFWRTENYIVNVVTKYNSQEARLSLTNRALLAQASHFCFACGLLFVVETSWCFVSCVLPSESSSFLFIALCGNGVHVAVTIFLISRLSVKISRTFWIHWSKLRIYTLMCQQWMTARERAGRALCVLTRSLSMNVAAWNKSSVSVRAPEQTSWHDLP